uniref:Uncharacterized protein n=1 Tax=Arundo donax TaxID=35708 RepID=A0A0A8YIG4_ARUDO
MPRNHKRSSRAHKQNVQVTGPEWACCIVTGLGPTGKAICSGTMRERATKM